MINRFPCASTLSWLVTFPSIFFPLLFSYSFFTLIFPHLFNVCVAIFFPFFVIFLFSPHQHTHNDDVSEESTRKLNHADNEWLLHGHHHLVFFFTSNFCSILTTHRNKHKELTHKKMKFLPRWSGVVDHLSYVIWTSPQKKKKSKECVVEKNVKNERNGFFRIYHFSFIPFISWFWRNEKWIFFLSLSHIAKFRLENPFVFGASASA